MILQLKRPEQYYNCAQLQNWDEQLLIQNVVSEIHVLSLFLPEFEPQICIFKFLSSMHQNCFENRFFANCAFLKKYIYRVYGLYK